MNPITALFAVLGSIVSLLVKLTSAAETGADSLNDLADLGRLKTKNLKRLTKVSDDAAFQEQLHKINQRRAKLKLDAVDMKSTQASTEEELESEDELKLSL